MVDVIVYAIPAFVLLLVVEAVSFKVAASEDLKGYEAKDTRTSLSMGMGNVVINFGWKAVVVVIYAGLYELTPLRVPTDAVWAWVALFFLDDFAYYWFHRVSHEVRVFWASHVVHHSSPVLQPVHGAAPDLGADDLLPVLDADRAAGLPAVDDPADAGRSA